MRQLFATDHRWQPARKIIAPEGHRLETNVRPKLSRRLGTEPPAVCEEKSLTPEAPGGAAIREQRQEVALALGGAAIREQREEVALALGGAAIREQREEVALALGGAAGEQCGGKPIAHEDTIIAILARPMPTGELPSLAFQRKEQELGALFAQLSVVDSLALDRRLSVNAPTDPIARLFSRFIPERRARLIAFVRDARRRDAVARSRAG